MSTQKRWSARESGTAAAGLKTKLDAGVDRSGGGTTQQNNHRTGVKAAVAALVDGAPASMRKFVNVHGETRADGTGRITIELVVSGDLPRT